MTADIASCVYGAGHGQSCSEVRRAGTGRRPVLVASAPQALDSVSVRLIPLLRRETAAGSEMGLGDMTISFVWTIENERKSFNMKLYR